MIFQRIKVQPFSRFKVEPCKNGRIEIEPPKDEVQPQRKKYATKAYPMEL